MAFGIPPKYIQEYNLDNLDKENFLVYAIETVSTILEWNVSFVSETGFVAYTNFSWSSWSEKVTVTINDKTASIKSECTGAQIIDWNKNKRNVKELISIIEDLRKGMTQLEVEAKIIELRQNYALKADDILNETPPSASKGKIEIGRAHV
jgi:rhomboid protease GluP